ncbi:MAG: EamA family transporter [Magnetovibrionaceae bacterium]
MPLPHVLVALVIGFIFGLTFVVIEVGLDSFPPILMSALRFMIAGWPFLIFYRHPGVPWRYVFAAAFLFGVCQFGFLFVGMDLGMPAGLSSLVLQVQAVFTVLLAIVLLGDRPRRLQWIGMVIAFAGIAAIALSKDQSSSLIGLILVIAAAASWGGFNIVMKKAHPQDLLRFMVWVCSLPVVPLLLISWVWEGRAEIEAAITGLDGLGLGCILYLALLSTTTGFGLWGWLMKRHDASKVAPVSLLVPVFGMSLAAGLLGERFGAFEALGAALVALGLVLNFWKSPKRASATDRA